MKTKLLARLLGISGLRPLLARASSWTGVLGLCYHRIGDGDTSVYDRGLWSANADMFDAQVRWLKARFDLIAPDDLPDVLAKRTGRHLLITFDDGYRDNYAAALPILRRNGVRATFFIATGFIDNPRLPWWDEIAWMVRSSRRTSVVVPPAVPAPVAFDEPDRERAVRTLLRAYKALPAAATDEYLRAVGEATGSGRCPAGPAADLWMTWDMIREMQAAGMAIGGHTVNHPVLARMPRENQQREISEGCRRLTEELGKPVLSFSYPVGNLTAFDEETRASLREAGVRFAFSYYGGYRTFDNWDDLDIRRVAIESEMTLDWFKARATLPWFM